MTGKVISIWTDGDSSTNHGMLAPDAGGPPLKFTQADTEDGEDGGVKALTTSLVSASVNYWYDGANGVAKKVRFAAGA